MRVFDSFSALSVGNGGFAFTADATGLQTFPERYRELPLATQAEWGWHTEPNLGGYKIEDASVLYDAHGRQVPYASAQNGPAGTWLRENPRRHLARARRLPAASRATARRRSRPSSAAVEQRLDLWSGTLDSRFTLDGRVVRVRTWAHPERDQIAVRVESRGAGSVADRRARHVPLRERDAHRRSRRLARTTRGIARSSSTATVAR